MPQVELLLNPFRGPDPVDHLEYDKLGQVTAYNGSPYGAATIQCTVPGHRDDLQKALSQPGPASSKVQTGTVLLQHVEGGDWTFLAITRYNSWQDFAAERAAASASDQGGWNDVRQHSSFHRDTIADRIFPK